MVSCTRCCLQSSMRVVNLFLSLCGIGMIIYTLWLLKKWQDGVALLSTVSSLPRPWSISLYFPLIFFFFFLYFCISLRFFLLFFRFIYTCLAVGIAVSLSTLSGHMVANCISNYTLCIVSSSTFFPFFVTYRINILCQFIP
jgi:hypothetical protein